MTCVQGSRPRAFKIHGVLKQNLREVIHAINRIGLSTQSVHRWGLQRFRSAVEERLEEAGKIIGAGRNEIPSTLPEPHPADVSNAKDHLGWFDQGDGASFLGIPVENGRVKDTDAYQLKSALRQLLSRYQFPVRITAQQNLLLADIPPSAQKEIENLLKGHGVSLADELTPIRRQPPRKPVKYNLSRKGSTRRHHRGTSSGVQALHRTPRSWGKFWRFL